MFPDGLREDRSEGIRTPSPNVFTGIHHRRWGGEVRVRQRGQRYDRKRDTSNGIILHFASNPFPLRYTIEIFHHPSLQLINSIYRFDSIFSSTFIDIDLT